MEDERGLAPGHWRLARRTRALHTYTHSRAHTNAPPLPSRAPPGCACGSASAAPLLPQGSRRRARACPLAPHAQPPALSRRSRPSGGRHGEPRASRAQPRPLCAYLANAAPAGANRGTRGEGLPRAPLKPPASARPGAWATVKGPGWRSPPVCCRQSAHWGAAPQLAWGLCDAVLTCAPGTLSTLSRSAASGWDRYSNG